VLLEACRALKPRWAAFILVCFTGGLRWGEATALYINDIDWSRSRLHVQRTWSEDGGRIEATKNRWVKLPASALETLRAQVEATPLEAQPNGWTHEQRRLVFPNSMGKVTRYGAFSEHVWQPLLEPSLRRLARLAGVEPCNPRIKIPVGYRVPRCLRSRPRLEPVRESPRACAVMQAIGDISGDSARHWRGFAWQLVLNAAQPRLDIG
jgi:integrase